MGTQGYLVNSRIFCMQTSLCNVHVTFTVPLLFTEVNIYIPLSTPDRIKVQYFPSNKQYKSLLCKYALMLHLVLYECRTKTIT